MLKTSFKFKLNKLIKNRKLIPDEFWVPTTKNTHRAIWFLSRQKPSVQQSYGFDEERFGLTKEGKIIYGFDSGCSCPSPFEDDVYHTANNWKEFETQETSKGFDPYWGAEAEKELNDYLLLIDAAKGELSPEAVLSASNAEVRRYLIKRVGYENIKTAVKAEVIHREGDSELLKFQSGEMYVKVKDSSTDREYLLYVPSGIKTCREGIAWTFGLKEEEYQPIIET